MWAHINHNGTVTELTNKDPAGRYHPSMEWVECSLDTQVGWIYDGTDCVAPPPEPIDDLAKRKRDAMDEARDAAFATGMAHTFPDGSADMVQTRPEDKSNLLGIAIEARDLKDAGVTDPTIEFRAASNTTYALTPEQAIAMTNAALAHVKAIYDQSWQRKDAIDAALAADDREAIESVAW